VAALINGWQPKDAHFVAKVVDDWVPEGSSEDAAKQLQVAAGQHVFVTDIATPWLMVTDATGATGWVPEDNVEDVKCRDTIGTLYEPRVKFDDTSFRPFEWIPIDGAERRPVWKDLAKLHSAVHSGGRVRDRESWRAGIEDVLDVEMFLKVMAAQVVIGNGDTYGRIPHNYAIYGPPCSSQPLVWAPYDLDAAWGKPGGDNPILPLPADPLDTEYSGVLESWSLLTHFMDDPEFRDRYYTRLESVVTMLHSIPLTEKLRTWQKQITPFLDPDSYQGEDVEVTKIEFDQFEQECEGLVLAVKERTDSLYAKLPDIAAKLVEAKGVEMKRVESKTERVSDVKDRNKNGSTKKKKKSKKSKTTKKTKKMKKSQKGQQGRNSEEFTHNEL